MNIPDIFDDNKENELNEEPEYDEYLDELADAANMELLPPKSKERYDRVYQEFKKWRNEKKVNSVSENILMAYFYDLSKKLKPTSLWSYHSMLKSTLNVNEKVDISKFCKLSFFLKRQSDDYTPTRASVFTEDEMKKFIFTADDKEWLLVKVSKFNNSIREPSIVVLHGF